MTPRHAPGTLECMEGPLFTLFLCAIMVYILYWTVRYAVRHALEDADERREETARRPPPP